MTWQASFVVKPYLRDGIWGYTLKSQRFNRLKQRGGVAFTAMFETALRRDMNVEIAKIQETRMKCKWDQMWASWLLSSINSWLLSRIINHTIFKFWSTASMTGLIKSIDELELHCSPKFPIYYGLRMGCQSLVALKCCIVSIRHLSCCIYMLPKLEFLSTSSK